MKLLPCCISSLAAGAIALASAGISVADDGEIFRRNASKTPDLETEHAAIKMLPLYVPAQASDGTVLTDGVGIYDADGTLVETRDYFQPLIIHYNDGHVETIEEEGYGGFPGHGERDAFASVSLDGGDTWKRSNLSKSADLSSFKIKLGGKQKVPYPGDVGRSFMGSDGNQVLVVWVSRYARGGSPNYAMTDDERSLVAAHLATEGIIPDATACTDGLDDANEPYSATPCLYLEDHFGVAGSQGSSDLADEGYPLIGELPYAALWVARGVILPPEATGLETSEFVWFKAERLSSAVRDANRPETVCVKGAGCVVTWQEDPDGIRPGEGEGPGEGWSGAIAHHQTDTWYSYISWDDFSLVSADGSYGSFYNDDGDLATWVAENTTGVPQAAIPMSIPVRLTDNAMCTDDGSQSDAPYCYMDFDGSGTADFCDYTVTVSIEVPDEGGEADPHDVQICVTEDGRLLRGNTASTRARLGLHGYSSTVPFSFADGADNSTFFSSIDSAWLTMSYEENKGLGDCEEDIVDPVDKLDMGKNVWYHTFDMFNPELVSQGLMLNQPAVYPEDFSDPHGVLTADSSYGYNFYTITTDPIYSEAGIDTTLFQTEIARRPSPISQQLYDAGPSKSVALQLWKQGIVRRGGPADIMGRLFRIPEGTGDCPTEEICDYDCVDTDVCAVDMVQECDEICSGRDNPDYRWVPGLCKKDPMPDHCYPYLDENDNPTEEPPSCEIDPTSCVDICPGDQWVQECTVIEGSCQEEPSGPCDDAFDSTTDNPYDYANMVCENADETSAWAFWPTDPPTIPAENPRYVKGFCAAPAINLSGNTIVDGECGDAEACFDAFPFGEYFDDIDMETAETDGISKIYEWEMVGPGSGEIITDPAQTNLDDTTWENPYDMAKGHRGFMTGDMIMMMYAWTPNWNDLTNAHSIVNLYIRRSFDGGATWSTLPSSFTHTNGETYRGSGTTTCENMGPIAAQYPVCVTYGAGDFEQARNVSQLLGSKVTVLDPRFSPTTRSITAGSVSTLLPAGFTAPLYDDDVRDPSRYFMVYETGITSAYDAGEAVPLDLFYSRAVEWGDQYLVWQEEATSDCLPAADNELLTGFCNEFDALEGYHDKESGEASVTTNPGGTFLFATWNQVDLDTDEDGIEYEVGSDAWFRRVLFVDDYIPE